MNKQCVITNTQEKIIELDDASISRHRRSKTTDITVVEAHIHTFMVNIWKASRASHSLMRFSVATYH